jgi:hypothetical protein
MQRVFTDVCARFVTTPADEHLSNLQAGYRVVFLTRSGTQQPFDDLLGDENIGCALARSFDAATGQLIVTDGRRDEVTELVHAVQDTLQRAGLLTLHFTTVFHYLAVREGVPAQDGSAARCKVARRC